MHAPAPDLSFDDYVTVSATVKAWGRERALAHHAVDDATWDRLVSGWTTKLVAASDLPRFAALVDGEAARLTAGGAPRALATRPSAGALPASAPGAPVPTPYNATPLAVAPAPPHAPPAPQAPPHPMAPRPPQSFDQQLGDAFSSLGNFAQELFGGLAPGARVRVAWSDGQRYPATVAAARGGQVEVVFPDGRRLWVPASSVSAF